MLDSYDNYFNILIIFLIVSLVPFIVMVSTCFVKLSIVLNMIRNAIGVQQIPPNLAIYAISLILTVYIMYPVAHKTYELTEQYQVNMNDINSVADNFEIVSAPWRTFLQTHTREEDLLFFIENTQYIWPKEYADTLDENSILILIPSFLISELTNAFEIGLYLFLPFLVIDLVVSNLLLSLGMMMVAPMTISLPFKILVFVLADGWSRLIQNLIFSYQVPL